MTSRSADRGQLGLGRAIDSGATVLDARFASLEVLRSLLPGLIIAIDIKTVAALTSLAESTIYAKLDESHDAFDPEFPPPAKLGKRSVWELSAVQDYLRHKFEAAARSPEPRLQQRSAKKRISDAQHRTAAPAE